MSDDNGAPPNPVDELPDDQRDQFDQIDSELARFEGKSTAAQGIAQLDRFLERIPDDEEHELLRGGLYARRGGLKLDLDRAESGLEDVERALEAGWREAETLASAGWAAYTLDRPGTAREYFDAALELDPDHVSSLTGRGLVLLDLDETELARSDFTHALNLDTGNPDLHALRSEVYVDLRELDKAEQDLRKARELAPDDPHHSLELARLMMAKGEIEEARAAISDAIAEDDVSLEALLLRSHLRLLVGDSSAARRDAIKASNNYPDEAFAFVQLAHVQLAEGNLTLAEKAADRAVKLDPSLPDGYMARGATHQVAGNQEAASEDLDRASQAPAELPMFLLGNYYDALEGSGFSHSMMDLLQQYTQQSAEGDQQAAGPAEPAGFGGMPDMDPGDMMGKMFDDEGNVDERVKPLLEMAVDNAPNILQNMPDGILKSMGGVDPEQLDDADLSDLSPEELEAQLEQFYEMMQSGTNPFDLFQQGDVPTEPTDDDKDD